MKHQIFNDTISIFQFLIWILICIEFFQCTLLNIKIATPGIYGNNIMIFIAQIDYSVKNKSLNLQEIWMYRSWEIGTQLLPTIFVVTAFINLGMDSNRDVMSCTRRAAQWALDCTTVYRSYWHASGQRFSHVNVHQKFWICQRSRELTFQDNSRIYSTSTMSSHYGQHSVLHYIDES